MLSQLKTDIVKILSKEDSSITEKDVEVKIYENSSGVQYTLEEFFNQYNPEEIGKGQCNLVFRIDMYKNTIASFQLKDMYNCCGIIVGSDLFVSKNYRGRGFGTLLTSFMEEFSRYYGYGILQGADRKENEYQKRIFDKLKWTSSSEFVNPKTGNVLNIWLLNLNENANK